MPQALISILFNGKLAVIESTTKNSIDVSKSSSYSEKIFAKTFDSDDDDELQIPDMFVGDENFFKLRAFEKLLVIKLDIAPSSSKALAGILSPYLFSTRTIAVFNKIYFNILFAVDVAEYEQLAGC